MVWVCPPHTSMNLYCRPGSHSEAIWAARGLRHLRVAELVDEAHHSILDSVRAFSSSWYAWPMPSRKARADRASSSSILDRANPTWMSTQSPVPTRPFSSSPMLMVRRTPLTFTLARSGRSCRISTTSPGIPRHMLAPSVGLVEQLPRQLPQDVVQGGLGLLDPVDRGRRHHEQVVDGLRLRHPAAVVPGQADGEQAAPTGLVEGPDQVVRVAAGGQAQGDVAGPAEGRQLAGEHDLEANVVGQSGEDRDVRGQAGRGKGPPSVGGSEEQGGHVLGIGARSPVPEGEELRPLPEGAGHGAGALDQELAVSLQARVPEGDDLVRL